MDKKVLIVEDEPDVGEYLKTVLEAEGYRTFLSDDARKAFETAKEVRPDLICLDIMMPRESGISFYIRLKKNDLLRGIPVVIVSGAIHLGEFDFRAYVPDTSIAPPEQYIEKPIVVEAFLKTVKELTAAGDSAKTRK